MYGAILGDIIGSPYEFDRGDKTKDFPLFSEESYFTDDTVMTVQWQKRSSVHTMIKMSSASG